MCWMSMGGKSLSVCVDRTAAVPGIRSAVPGTRYAIICKSKAQTVRDPLAAQTVVGVYSSKQCVRSTYMKTPTARWKNNVFFFSFRAQLDSIIKAISHNGMSETENELFIVIDFRTIESDGQNRIDDPYNENRN